MRVGKIPGATVMLGTPRSGPTVIIVKARRTGAFSSRVGFAWSESPTRRLNNFRRTGTIHSVMKHDPWLKETLVRTGWTGMNNNKQPGAAQAVSKDQQIAWAEHLLALIKAKGDYPEQLNEEGRLAVAERRHEIIISVLSRIAMAQFE